MHNACVTRFDVMKNLENFLELNKALETRYNSLTYKQRKRDHNNLIQKERKITTDPSYP